MDIIKNIKKYILGDSFGKYELLPIGKLKVDEEYQRNKIDAHIKDIANNLDLAAFGVIIVNKRTWQNNDFYILDGFQRISALQKAGYDNDFKVPCIVHELKSRIDESVLFTKLNVQSKNLSTLQRFWPRILQSNPVSTGMYKVVTEENFEIPKHSQKNLAKTLSNRIDCIDTLEKIYSKQDKGILLRKTLNLVNKYWPDMKYNTEASLVSGLSHFILTYENTKFLDYEHLEKTLSNNTPREIKEEGNKIGLGDAAGGEKGGGKVWCETFVSFYNKNLSADKKINDDEKAWIRLNINSLDAVKKEYLLEKISV